MSWSKYTYLALDLFTLLGPFALSFDKKVAFYKNFKLLFPAIFLSAIPFLIWDEIFTQKGIWGFNPNYLTGIYFFSLPLEEVLFFIVVPYACLFIYACAVNYKISFFKENSVKLYFNILALALLLVGLFNYTKLYTTITFVGFGTLILFTQNLLSYKNEFLTAYIISLIPFLLVNGVLTYLPVVWYNNAENLSLRIISIPVEDTMYGFSLIYLNKLWMDVFSKYTKKPLQIT